MLDAERLARLYRCRAHAGLRAARVLAAAEHRLARAPDDWTTADEAFIARLRVRVRQASAARIERAYLKRTGGKRRIAVLSTSPILLVGTISCATVPG